MDSVSFFARIWLSFVMYWKVLFDGQFAAQVLRLSKGLPAPKAEPEPTPAPRAEPLVREASTDAALQLLALLQREGRFVDFIEEDVASFSDAEIGAAARVVHEGCRKAIREHVKLEAVRSEQEGARLEVPKGFDAGSIRLSGNVVGEPPFKGVLRHRGWRAAEVHLPKLAVGHDVRVIAAAEVEL